ncbi:MAG: methyl-accepting chemotaxis protein [Desulfobacter sp.]
MKLNAKLIRISLAGFVMILSIGLVSTILYFNRVKQGQIQNTVQAAQQNFEAAMAAKKKVWQTNALQVAGNANVRQAVIDNDREAADRILKTLGRTFKENTGFKNVQIHLIDRDLRSFYKSWAPDSHGESLGHSAGYALVRDTQKSFVAMEVSGKGLRLKGLFPIMDNGRFAGIANFEGGLNSIKRTLKPYDIEFLYFMDKTGLAVAKGMENKPGVGTYILNQKDVDKAYFDYIRQPGIFNRILESDYIMDEKYLSFKGRFKGFGSTDTGLYLLGVRTETAMAGVNALKGQIFTLVGLLCGIFIVFILGILYFISRKVVAPIRNIAGGMEDIAGGQGDLTKRLDITSRDEIGELGGWFNTFIRKLDGLIWDVSDGTQTQGVFSNELSGVAELMALNAGEVSSRAADVSAAAADMDADMTSVSSAMAEASESVEQVAAAAEEMAASIKQIAGNTETTSSIARQAVGDANNASENIAGLGTSARDIGKVMDVIQDISAQTNLLALNATIEAARAGEAGRGFAVVAGEIKTLAGQAADAAVDIRNKVENIQVVSTRAAEEIRQVTGIINEAYGLVSEVATAVEEQAVTTQEISANIHKVSAGFTQINATVAGAAESAGRIAGEIVLVDASSGEMNEYSSQVMAAATQQGLLTERITRMMSQFKLSDDRFHAAPVKRAHSLWKKRLSDMLAGKAKLDPAELTDHRDCEFGQWYFSKGIAAYGDNPVFKEIDRHHEKVHSIAREVARLYNANDREGAKNLFRTYRGVTDTLFDLLDKLEQEINSGD